MRLLRKYTRLAVWGMNFQAADLFQQAPELRDENIYPIDISESVQASDLFGSASTARTSIREAGIPAVVVALPQSFIPTSAA